MTTKKHIRFSITQKAFIYLLVACVFPTLAFGLFSYNKATTIFKHEVNIFNYDLMNNKQKYLELIMQNVESLILNLSNLDDIKTTVINDFDENNYNKLAAQSKIGHILSGYSNLKGLISIDLFSMNGRHYHVGETLNFQEIRDDLKEQLYIEASESGKSIVWNGIEENVNLNSTFKKVITATKAIKAVDSSTMEEKPIGLIIVNYDIDAFTDSIKNNTYQEAFYLLIDSKNRVVYYPDDTLIGKQVNPAFMKKLDKNSGSFTDRINGEKMIITYLKSDMSGWTIAGLVPTRVFNAKASAVSKSIVYPVIVCVLMLLLFTFIISNKYLLPVKKITELFKQFQEGSIDLGTKLIRSSNDEMGELVIWFNAFMDSLKEKKNMEQEIQDRDKLLGGIADATNVLLEETQHDAAFYKALQILGIVTGVDRVYLFQNHTCPDTGEVLTSQRFEWCRDGISRQINNPDLQNLNYSTAGISHWYSILSSYKTISGLVKELPEDGQLDLSSQGIISILIVPIFIENYLWGFIGFDDCTKERKWSDMEENTLKVAAASIGGAFKRIQSEDTLQNILKDDFRKTVQNLQNLVFKLKTNEEGYPVFTLFEGKMANEFSLNTGTVYGKRTGAFVDGEAAYLIESNALKAFEGEISTFEVSLNNKVYYITLSPIKENDVVCEIVGSAIDITGHKKAEEKIRYMAYYDALTGLPNRALFNDRLEMAIKRANRLNSMVAVLYLDLDQFKKINDTLGHASGDILLKEVAARLQSSLHGDDSISRMGGDEFTILLPGLNDNKDAMAIAKRVLSAFKAPFTVNQYELFVTTSIGISLYPLDGADMDTLLKNADIAMYMAKDNGRNNYQFYTSMMNSFVVERLHMENNLRKAIDQNEFALYYQPKLNAHTGEVTGCEALIRWNRPESGMIMPGDFIPVAEETGLIIPIGEWVLRTACMQNKRWHDAGYENICISVNISAKQFQHQNFVGIISSILKNTGLSPECLELEITENCIMQNTNGTSAIIDELKSTGVQISIDDFGTGFSSMAYLKRFQVDKLKIDKSFIVDINTNPGDAAITSAIINMAHTLNLKVVAEGVETEDQLSMLKLFKCDEIQGYLFAKPLDASAFESYIGIEAINLINAELPPESCPKPVFYQQHQ